MAMTQHPLSILLIDDKPASRAFLGGRLAALGNAVRLAGSRPEGLAALAGSPFDLVLIKLSRREADGMPVARFARRFAPQTTVVNLQPGPGPAEPCDLTLAAPGEIHYFFDTLRYLASTPQGANHHLPPGSLP
jgi:CheY-like chemotaxis protein